MKKFFVICILATFIACDEDKGYTISGTIDNFPEEGKIYLSELDVATNRPIPIDTIEVIGGKFEADLPEKESPTLSFLSIDGARGNVVFVADNTPITFEIYKDSLYASEISGGEDNQVLSEYLDQMMEAQGKMEGIRASMMEAFSSGDTTGVEDFRQSQQEIIDQMQEKKKLIVQENPNSLVSLLVLQDLINSRMFPTSELQELYEGISTELKESDLGQKINEELSNLRMTEVGNKAPNFTAPTPDGTEISLNETLGEVTLIDFWASWCKPCREENPNIVRVYEKYHGQGFNIIGVSLDRPGQKEKWEEAIAEDNLSWPQVSNLMFWQDPVARKYGVRSIPAAFLLDENGIIVAKNLRGKDLENKVAEMLAAE